MMGQQTLRTKIKNNLSLAVTKMSLQSPSEDRSNDIQSNNTGSIDQQYKTWDIVKATQVSICYLCSVCLSAKFNIDHCLSMEYLTDVKS